MGLRFLESFDAISTADLLPKWTSIDGSPTVTAAIGRRGTAALRTNGGESVRKTLSAKATWIVGFAFSTQLLSSTVPFFRLLDAGTVQCALHINPSGTITVTRGSSSSLGSTVAALTASTYAYIEFKVTIHDTTGAFELRINGVNVLSASNVDTKQTSNATVDGIEVGSIGGSAVGNYDYDDLYVCDGDGSVNNDFLGDKRVDALLPNGNGNSSQLTGSDGNSVDNYLLVDESDPDQDSTYVESSTVGQKDTYAFANISHAPSSINGLIITALAKKDDAGARSICTVTRSGGADTDGATEALSTAYAAFQTVRETDPATGLAWTVSGVNAAEHGVKVAA